MGFYDKYILPKLINAAMKAPDMTRLRKRLVPLAEGNVLEIGVGSGLNLPFYDRSVNVIAVDPSEELQVYARDVASDVGINVEFVAESGETLPLDDNSFDSCVMTWTLCTIPNPTAALAEIRRVVKPGGKIIFAEHGKSPDEGVARWQDRLNPIWGVIGGGCNLNRPMEDLYQGAGFKFDDLEKGYIDGPKFAAYNYRGVARIA